jgi:hypothetical protein
MACQVMAHYPEEIFPRVVRNARCREDLGERDVAADCYRSILSDFQQLELTELLVPDAEPLQPADRTIIDAVCTAAQRLGELRPEGRPQLAELQQALLARLAPGSSGQR